MGELPTDNQNNNQAPPAPKATVTKEDLPIDKFFWFNLSRKWIAGGIQNVIEICERLKTAITWFFGLGTSGFFLSMVLGSETFKGLDLTLLPVPLGLFFISYSCAVFGQTLSISREFKPNRSRSIRIAYNAVMKKSKRFIIASGITFLLGLVSFPLVIGMAVEKKKAAALANPKPEFALRGVFVMRDTLIKKVTVSRIAWVHISGTLPDIKQARLIIEKGKSPLARTVIGEAPVLPDEKTGMFFMLVQVSIIQVLAAEEKVYVSVEYELATVGFKRHTIPIEAMK
jgi:hypothetical protein